jgi:hypothetical protein
LDNAGVTALIGSDGVTASASTGSVTLGLGSMITLSPGGPPAGITSGGYLLMYADVNGDFFAGSQAGNETSAGLGGFGNNTAIGDSALPVLTTGSYNTAEGIDTLYYDTDGYQNTAIGAFTLFENTHGYNNTAIGYAALESNVTGGNNTAVGYAALGANEVGLYNTAIGAFALWFNTNSYNTANGYQALENNESGFYNTANGYSALQHNVSAEGNTADGALALEANTSGGGNTADGYQTMENNITGYANTADGAGALYFNTNGTSNVAVGGNSLSANQNGSDNVAVGDQALLGCPGGNGNIAIGTDAGMSLSGSESYDIYIGNNGVVDESDVIRIGNGQSATYLSGKVYGTSFNSTSDRNAKEDFAAVNPQQVLAKVATLPVTEWNYKTDKGVEHIGPMAQDFHSAFGLNGGDDKHISVVDEGGVALAAIQGLNQKVDELKTELTRRDAENAALKQQNDSLAKQLNELASAVRALGQKGQEPK